MLTSLPLQCHGLQKELVMLNLPQHSVSQIIFFLSAFYPISRKEHYLLSQFLAPGGWIIMLYLMPH